MRDCPECGKPVDGDACVACGYREAGASAQPLRDPLWWVCVYVDRGQRCANPGSFRESTTGGDGWFCKQHYPPFAHRNSVRKTSPAGGFDHWRQQAGMARPKPVDFEAVAERLAIQGET